MAQPTGDQSDPNSKPPRRRILIGSQRDPAAYQAKQPRDWIPLPEPDAEQEAGVKKAEAGGGGKSLGEPEPPAEPIPAGTFPPPSIRDELPPDLEQELNEALGDTPLDELMTGGDSLTAQPQLEPESQHTGRVVAVHRDDVFVELGGREQGCVSLKQFAEPPEPGTTLEVIVRRFNPDDGLYDLSIPDAAVEVDDWADLSEGMLVEARITGHNAGGLECEVNHLRGFIPISQVSLYRVENLAEFVDQKFTCLVTETNPERRNLVLSRRAVLEREKEEAREKLLASLQPDQVHEGVVRRLVNFGAFVDIGGIDGLLHVSQLAWGRINHPSDVLAEGQRIKVKIEKIDRAAGKISFGYRDMLENPWETAAAKYPVNSLVQGTVTSLMKFGAFVELEPSIEGLVHISELSHRPVRQTSDVVHQGDKVEVLILSVDSEAQRISLSMKHTAGEPEPAGKDEQIEPPPARTAKHKKPDKPLKGGLDKSTRGRQSGLNW